MPAPSTRQSQSQPQPPGAEDRAEEDRPERAPRARGAVEGSIASEEAAERSDASTAGAGGFRPASRALRATIAWSARRRGARSSSQGRSASAVLALAKRSRRACAASAPPRRSDEASGSSAAGADAAAAAPFPWPTPACVPRVLPDPPDSHDSRGPGENGTPEPSTTRVAREPRRPRDPSVRQRKSSRRSSPCVTGTTQAIRWSRAAASSAAFAAAVSRSRDDVFVPERVDRRAVGDSASSTMGPAHTSATFSSAKRR